MSDSDDTDVLLLAQPPVFIEPINRDLELNCLQTEVVGNLISQVNELENRISLIESINSSCGKGSFAEIASYNSMVFNERDLNLENSVPSVGNNEELVCQRDLVSPPLALNTCEINSNTESSLDLNHDENGMSKSKESLLKEIDLYLNNIGNNKILREEGEGPSYDYSRNGIEKEDYKMAEDVPIQSPSFKRLDLPEVDRLLKEMEATQLEIENKLRSREIEYGLGNQRSFINVAHRKSFPPVDKFVSSQDSVPHSVYNSPLKIQDFNKKKQMDDFHSKRDVYLVGSSLNSDSDDARRNGDNFNENQREPRLGSSFDNRRHFVSPRRRLFGQEESIAGRKPASGQSSSSNLPHKATSGKDFHKMDYFSHLAAGDGFPQKPIIRGTDGNVHRTPPLKYNRDGLLSLAELWKSEKEEDDSKKLKQKLEEEKFRRIHLENTIQDLQKRVLEEQEKLAVAVKVDEGKDKAIAQITEAWKQMVNHWREIEADRHALSQSIIKERAEIKQTQEEVNKKVERWEKEVSQALDLAAGYKSKCEFLENELSVTLEAHSEKIKELEGKVKASEEELERLNEERKTLTEKLNLSEEEHNKEKQLVELAQRELSSLQETFKKTEAELLIVTEQRDLLSTRLREEKGRNSTLEQQKLALQDSLEETKQKLLDAEDSIKNSGVALEKTKAELRAVYQSQLEAVVKEKLEEFQSQLDRAQTAMKVELTEARRLAQERSAAQQQALVNSHMLEMRRLETIHKEQIKSLETKLTESERRREKLESGKKEIAHRLHGVMEAQWQQALSIITSEMSLIQGESETRKNKIQEINEELKMNPIEGDSVDNTSFERDFQGTNQQNSKKDTLLKYIQILLDKQPGKPIDSGSSSQWPDVTQSDIVDDTLPEYKWNQVISNMPPGVAPLQGTLKPFPPNQRKPPWK